MRASLLLVALALPGCTAARTTVQLVAAQKAVAQARELDAPELAAYEYTLAEQFLDKARDEAGTADYKVAVEYAKRAQDLADQSIILVQERQQAPGGVAAPVPAAPRPVEPERPRAAPVPGEAGPDTPTPLPVPPGIELPKVEPAKMPAPPPLAADPYPLSVRAATLSAWKAQLEAIPRAGLATGPRSAEVEVVLRADGSLSQMGVTRSSGEDAFDQSISKAFGEASPFDLPPAEAIGDDGRVHLPPMTLSATLEATGWVVSP